MKVHRPEEYKDLLPTIMKYCNYKLPLRLRIRVFFYKLFDFKIGD